MGDTVLTLMVELGKLVMYALVGAVIMGVSLGLFLRILERITPINEWEELKKGNIAVAIYFGMAVLALGLTIMASILPTTHRISPEPIRIVIKQEEPDQDPALIRDVKKAAQKVEKAKEEP